MNNSEIIGYVASTCYVCSLFPEIIVVYKTKECNLTMSFLLFQILTTSLFITYDVMMQLMPLLLADSLLLVEIFYLIIYKIKKYNSKVISTKNTSEKNINISFI